MRAKVLYIASAVVIILLLSLALFRILPLEAFRAINLLILFIGGGLRLAAHDQQAQGWKDLDGTGKVIAYYGAFSTLVTLGT
ncbi:hypothetical protein [Curtobacterium sp. MCLR17_055]|uniref:hypothetical protein n=1 Tax=Curtobacterium sp. MCLR17_055 TaxID=2175633 RepID=UPI0011B40845|nr:hypothetical protein [Curtobacterium sp. MCLR17_055]